MLGNWVRCTTTTTGTGSLTLSSVSGYPTVNDALGLAVRSYYSILDDSAVTPIECGIGYLSGSTTYVREKVLATVSGGTFNQIAPTAISLSAGTKRVIISVLAQSAMPCIPPGLGNAGGTGKYINNANCFTDQSGGTANCIDASGRLNGWPFLHTYGGEVDAFVAQVSGAQSGTIMRCGLYAFSNGVPTDLIVEGSTSMDLGSTGVKTATFTSRVIPPGWYWMAEVSTATTASLISPTTTLGASAYLPSPFGVIDRQCAIGGYALGVATSAMPTTHPAFSGVTPNLRPPTIQFRAV